MHFITNSWLHPVFKITPLPRLTLRPILGVLWTAVVIIKCKLNLHLLHTTACLNFSLYAEHYFFFFLSFFSRDNEDAILQVDVDDMGVLFTSLVEYLRVENAYNIFILNPKRDIKGPKYGYRSVFLWFNILWILFIQLKSLELENPQNPCPSFNFRALIPV